MFYRDVLIESRERNTFMSKELQIRNSTVDFLVFTRDAGEDGIEVRVQNGKTYNYKFYSLAAIIAVGYRINSERAMQFRTWATKVLDTFTKQGCRITLR